MLGTSRGFNQVIDSSLSGDINHLLERDRAGVAIRLSQRPSSRNAWSLRDDVSEGSTMLVSVDLAVLGGSLVICLVAWLILRIPTLPRPK